MGIFNKTTEEKKSDPKAKAAAKQEEKKATKELYAAETAKKADKKESKFENAYKVLLKPLVTEKASIGGQFNKYFFEVSSDANKVEVAKAVEKVYGIKPVRVNMINTDGKKVRYGRYNGKRKDWKKAIVTLPEGQSIKVYEGV